MAVTNERKHSDQIQVRCCLKSSDLPHEQQKLNFFFKFGSGVKVPKQPFSSELVRTERVIQIEQPGPEFLVVFMVS